jgi:hypothetical protein
LTSAQNAYSEFYSGLSIAYSAASNFLTVPAYISSKFSGRNGYPIVGILRDSTSDAILVDLPVCLVMTLTSTALKTGLNLSAYYNQLKEKLPMVLFAETTAAICNYAIRKIFREGDNYTMLGGVIAGVVKYG